MLLFDKNHHFVDSNMVIGFTVGWDNPNATCKKYMKKARKEKCNLYTSKTVKEEVEEVLEKARRKLKQALFKIHKDFNYVSSQTLKKDLKGFLRKHFGNLKSVVMNYISHRLNEIRDLIKNPQKLDAKLGMVDKDLDEPMNFIYNLASDETVFCYIREVPEDYTTVFENKWRALSRILHTKDRYIILDAYHFLKSNGIQRMVFVSLDKDFIKNGTKEKIENHLSGLSVHYVYDIFVNT